MDKFKPKYATVEDSVLEVKESRTRLPWIPDSVPGASLARFASMEDTPLQEGEDGYLYVRARAISSRVNKNNDGWPSEELAKSYKTFVGRPIFVDHNNSDVSRTRGVIIDSRLHVEDEKTSALDPYYATAPDNHQPPTWVEILMEVDAKTFPDLAESIRKKEVTATSMGANIEESVCSVCENKATAPSQYCAHVKQKGATFEIEADNGEKHHKKAYEDCYGITFFEDSFVFDPADETADVLDHTGRTAAGKGTNKPADENEDRQRNYVPQSEQVSAPQEVNTLRDELLCKNCEADHYQEDSDGILRCPTCGDETEPRPLDNPDLSQALKEQPDEAAQDSDEQVTFDEDKQEQGAPANNFIEPIAPIKPSVAAGVINDMKFVTRFETDDVTAIDQLHPVTGARQETTVTYPGGIHGGTHAAMFDAGLQGTVTYPSGETLPLPDERANRHFGQQIRYKREAGLPDLSQVPIVLEFPDDQIEHATAIVHNGGPVAGGGPVAASTKKVINPGGRITQPKGEKVIKDQSAPVESKLVVKDDMTDTREADRRKIVRTEGPDGNRTEEIIEETGDLDFAGEADKPKAEAPKKEEPKADAEEPSDENEETEEKEDSKKKQPSFASAGETKLLAAFALAEDAVDLKLISKDDKLAFVAKLEKESIEQIDARRDMIALTKAAGLTKQVRRASLQSLPRVASTSGDRGTDWLSNVDDAAIFLSQTL